LLKELTFWRTIQRIISIVKVLQETKHFIVDQRLFKIQPKVTISLNLFEFLLQVVKENRNLYPPTRFVVFGFLFFVVWSFFFLKNFQFKFFLEFFIYSLIFLFLSNIALQSCFVKL
jgi:hypothetical protein